MNYPDNLYIESEIFSLAKNISNVFLNFFSDFQEKSWTKYASPKCAFYKFFN